MAWRWIGFRPFDWIVRQKRRNFLLCLLPCWLGLVASGFSKKCGTRCVAFNQSKDTGQMHDNSSVLNERNGRRTSWNSYSFTVLWRCRVALALGRFWF